MPPKLARSYCYDGSTTRVTPLTPHYVRLKMDNLIAYYDLNWDKFSEPEELHSQLVRI